MSATSPKRLTLADVLVLPIQWDTDLSEFVWSRNVARRCKKGDVVGGICSKTGYRRTKYHGKYYYIHRLAYVWHTGQTLTQCIDHINGDRSDNRRENLRQVTHRVNNQNKRRYTNNTTGVTGVRMMSTGRFNSFIWKNGRRLHIGCHDTLDEASRARRGAEINLGYHTNHGNVMVLT
jgi:hypothetical protein